MGWQLPSLYNKQIRKANLLALTVLENINLARNWIFSTQTNFIS